MTSISIGRSLCRWVVRFKPLSNPNPRNLHNTNHIRHTFNLTIVRRFSVISRIKESSGSAHGGGSIASRVSTMSQEVHFALSSSCALKIRKGDITQWSVDGSSDAIVAPANERMLGGGGADGAIHRAAGPELRAACYNVPEVRPGIRCPTGEARITQGFRLPASHVIHTVGPIYDVDGDPEASLRSAYRNSLRVAKENSIQYVAFPAISCGIYGYPFDEAATVAISSIREFANDFKGVHFVLFADDIFDVWLKKANELLRN
ncbi:uncharacterized protein LOC132270723 [Cornus florida]|uniref:uncharacterized protein LOC132270723 n=1 Tax=Cornus florida TaxID=4283 RepID=UPI002896DF71|nr:uncharacterized protein LOC132270723 [Cornus florida]